MDELHYLIARDRGGKYGGTIVRTLYRIWTGRFRRGKPDYVFKSANDWNDVY